MVVLCEAVGILGLQVRGRVVKLSITNFMPMASTPAQQALLRESLYLPGQPASSDTLFLR